MKGIFQKYRFQGPVPSKSDSVSPGSSQGIYASDKHPR